MPWLSRPLGDRSREGSRNFSISAPRASALVRRGIWLRNSKLSRISWTLGENPSREAVKSSRSQTQLRDDFTAYLDGFSPNVQEILDSFEFRNQIPRLTKADALGALIEKFLDPSVNLSPNSVLHGDGAVTVQN